LAGNHRNFHDGGEQMADNGERIPMKNSYRFIAESDCSKSLCQSPSSKGFSLISDEFHH